MELLRGQVASLPVTPWCPCRLLLGTALSIRGCTQQKESGSGYGDRPGRPPLSFLGNHVSERCWHGKPSALRTSLPRSSLGLRPSDWMACSHLGFFTTVSASFLHALQTNMSRPGREGEMGEVCHCQELRSPSGRMQEEPSVYRELEDQEKSARGKQPSLALCTGRRPDPDLLAVLPRASLQHLCPGTEGGMGVRGELRAGPSPGEGLPGMRCC